MKDVFRESSNPSGKTATDKYDFCIVLPLDPSPSKPCGSLTEKGQEYIVQLRRLGFEMITQYGTQPQEELYVLLRLPMKKLISVAARVNMRMELDPAVLKVRNFILPHLI